MSRLNLLKCKRGLFSLFNLGRYHDGDEAGEHSGANVIKLFSPSLMKTSNKLERLALANLSSQIFVGKEQEPAKRLSPWGQFFVRDLQIFVVS